MFKNLRLSVKLIGGFVFVALITLLVGYMGWNSAASLNGHLQNLTDEVVPSVQNLIDMKQDCDAMRGDERTLIIPQLDFEARQRQYQNMAKNKEEIRKSWIEYDKVHKSGEVARLWDQVKPQLEAWLKAEDEIVALSQAVEKTGILQPDVLRKDLEIFEGDHLRLQTRVLHLIQTKEDFAGGEDHTACNFGKWSAQFKTDNPVLASAVKEISSDHHVFHQSVKKIKDLVKRGDAQAAFQVYEKEMAHAAKEVFEHFHVMLKEADKSQALYDKMYALSFGDLRNKRREAFALLDKLIDFNIDLAKKADQESMADASRTKFVSMAGMIVGFAIALLLGIFLSLSITRPLNRVIVGLSDGSDQVSSASTQVSSSSQSLAQGTSEQAAALEETSSSLEQMASMTRANAENARQADSLMGETARVVDAANSSMSDLTVSMKEVSQASEETAKIIKTIDEIAFQTNLLALNAAVEAARAGEAGAGFAVVADEVRNLAMRAAEAAKNTANLIEGTVTRVKGGSDLVGKTAEAFAQVAGSANKVKELVSEIAAASAEQSQGVDQVNKAVNEMNNVTQQTAANAEESASASEELNAQAEQMKVYVQDLTAIVGGSGNGGDGPGKIKGRLRLQGAISGVRQVLHRPAPDKKLLAHHQKGRAVTPEQIIPLEEGDFKDF